MLRVEFEGNLDAAQASEKLRAIEVQLHGEGSALIVDCLAMTGYENRARQIFTDWHRRHVDRLSKIAVLTDKLPWHPVVAAIAWVTGANMRAFHDDAGGEDWLADRPRPLS